MLLGRNGAGKTTTLRTIMGLWQRERGRDPLRRPRHRGAGRRPTSPALGIAYVPESMAIFADLTVQENLLLAARGGPPDDAAARLDLRPLPGAEALLAAARPGNLSGGQKQMLAVARAIVEPRRLLLIDEPTKGLAPAIIANMIAAFRELKDGEHHDPAGRAELRFARPLGDSSR